MQKYQNLGGDSGVDEFENGDTYIIVKFKDASTYKYSYVKPGSQHVETMKALAINGQGLNSYISSNRDVKYCYEVKLS